MTATLERQLAHLTWADRRSLASLFASGGLPPRALEVFGHVIGSQRVWLSRIAGFESPLAVWPSLSLEACEAGINENEQDLAAQFARLRSEGGRTIVYRNSAGAEFESTVEDILEHVALHSAYHRGQVATLLREAGFAPNATDYIAWRRGAPAATRTPLE